MVVVEGHKRRWQNKGKVTSRHVKGPKIDHRPTKLKNNTNKNWKIFVGCWIMLSWTVISLFLFSYFDFGIN